MPTAFALIDEAADKLNEDNRVEECWFLRGICDGLAGREMDLETAEDPNYGSKYRRGFASADNL